jgi:hypothetical protein
MYSSPTALPSPPHHRVYHSRIRRQRPQHGEEAVLPGVVLSLTSHTPPTTATSADSAPGHERIAMLLLFQMVQSGAHKG